MCITFASLGLPGQAPVMSRGAHEWVRVRGVWAGTSGGMPGWRAVAGASHMVLLKFAGMHCWLSLACVVLLQCFEFE